MTPTEALALAERAIRRGSCSAGCATCAAGELALVVLRERLTLPVIATCGACRDGVLISTGGGMVSPRLYSWQCATNGRELVPPSALPALPALPPPPPAWCPLRDGAP